VNADPRFQSLANQDLRLQSGSPAIDAGAALSLAADFDGVPRPQGRAIDIGAFEYFQGQAPPPPAGPRVVRIADAFSYEEGPLAPGKLISLFGSGLGPVEGVITAFDARTGSLPTTAGGTTVSINGRAIPLLYVRADQINAQVPYELTPGGPATLVVAFAGQSSQPLTPTLDAEQPGLFPQAFHPGFAPVTAENPVRASGVVIFFATGQGAVRPAVPAGMPAPAAPLSLPVAEIGMDFAGRFARVEFAGLTPGTAGVMQVHAIVPTGIASPVTAVLRVGLKRSQAVAVPFR
jgi:uncharacterized protein (TIGR03437 family)